MFVFGSLVRLWNIFMSVYRGLVCGSDCRKLWKIRTHSTPLPLSPPPSLPPSTQPPPPPPPLTPQLTPHTSPLTPHTSHLTPEAGETRSRTLTKSILPAATVEFLYGYGDGRSIVTHGNSNISRVMRRQATLLQSLAGRKTQTKDTNVGEHKYLQVFEHGFLPGTVRTTGTSVPRCGGAKEMTPSWCMCEPTETAQSLGDDTHAVAIRPKWA